MAIYCLLYDDAASSQEKIRKSEKFLTLFFDKKKKIELEKLSSSSLSHEKWVHPMAFYPLSEKDLVTQNDRRYEIIESLMLSRLIEKITLAKRQ